MSSTLTFKTVVDNGIAIIEPSGDLVFQESLYTLRPRLRELLEQGVRGFVFDLSAVKHCDSSGCGEVIGAYTTICKGGGAVAFAKLTPRVRTLWDRIKVTPIFNMVDTVEEGVAKLTSQARPSS